MVSARKSMIRVARIHLAMATVARYFAGYEEEWEMHMNYAAQARRMAREL